MYLASYKYTSKALPRSEGCIHLCRDFENYGDLQTTLEPEMCETF